MYNLKYLQLFSRKTIFGHSNFLAAAIDIYFESSDPLTQKSLWCICSQPRVSLCRKKIKICRVKDRIVFFPYTAPFPYCSSGLLTTLVHYHVCISDSLSVSILLLFWWCITREGYGAKKKNNPFLIPPIVNEHQRILWSLGEAVFGWDSSFSLLLKIALPKHFTVLFNCS